MRIFVATPCYGGTVTEAFHASVVDMLAHHDWSVPDVRFMPARVSGMSLVTMARNRLAAGFLHSDSDAILWLDADVMFSPRDVNLLLAADKELVGGVYALKVDPLVPRPGKPWFAVYPERDPKREGDLATVRGVGWGFTLIRREVFERLLPDATPYADENGEIIHDFFATEIVDGQYHGEDIAFCSRWRRAGGEVWGHFGVQVGHVGNYTYRGPAQKT